MTTPPQLDEVLDSVYFAANNSLYVVGEVRTGTSTSYYATIKYSYGGSSGSPNDVKWTYYPSSSGSGNRRGVAIAASVVYVPTDDSEGPPTSEPRPTIFVTGIVPGGDESGNDTDVYTIAYDEDLTTTYWMERMDPGQLPDVAADISAHENYVAVTATCGLSGSGKEIYAVMYDGIDGTKKWVHHLGSSGTEDDIAVGGMINGNTTYVVGTTWYSGLRRVAAMAYDTDTGGSISGWPRYYANPNGYEAVATCMTVEPYTGGLYVGGITGINSTSVNQDYLVVSFFGSGWADISYDYSGHLDAVTSIAARRWKPTSTSSVQDVVYVTGYGQTSTGGFDIVTRQYVDGLNTTPSTQVWDASTNDKGVAMVAVGGSEQTSATGPNIIVAGLTQGTNGDLNMVALKYESLFDSQTLTFSLSSLRWGGNPLIHADSAGGDDVPATLVRNVGGSSADSFLMGGRSWGGTTTTDDMLTVHYTDP